LAEKRGLGRGLSALIGDPIAPEGDASAERAAPLAHDRDVPIESVHPNPDQPRRDFDRGELEDLANSIRSRGILQPLLVRAAGDAGQYQIVAGERRWRAAQLAQLHEVPVIVRDYNDEEVLEIAIIENVQRADLNPVEEAAGYRQLIERFGHTQEQLAKALSKSRSHIANQIRLLALPEPVLDMLRRGELSAGHARAIITAPDPVRLAREIVKRGLSVRQAEKLARPAAAPKPGAAAKRPEKSADTVALEGDLSASLGMKVSIDHDGPGGRVTIRYSSLDDLDRLCQSLSQVERLAR